MTTWLRITQIARRTNLSRRYWQRRFARGEVPGARQVRFGQRRLFLADRHQFEMWWANHLVAVAPSAGLPQIASTNGFAAKPLTTNSFIRPRNQRSRPLAAQPDSGQRSFVFDEDRTWFRHPTMTTRLLPQS